MPTGLVRYHHEGHFHFITCSCFRHKPLLATPHLRDLFQQILFQTAARYRFQLQAWVIMPNHIHLILTEPKVKSVATIMQVLKQRYAVAMKKADPALYRQIEQETAHPPPMPIWETRYYDFNLTDPETYDEKVHYIHQNPVRAGLSKSAADYKWSSHPPP